MNDHEQKINQATSQTLPAPPNTTHTLKEIESHLKPFEIAFAKAYVHTGYNGTRAYLSLKPHVTYGTAAGEASAMLKKPHIKALIDLLSGEIVHENVHSKLTCLSHMDTIRQKSMAKDKLQTALKATVDYATLAGHYKPNEDDMSQYQQFINSLVVVQDNRTVINNNTTIEGGVDEHKPIEYKE
jgi:hypothetical protein